MYIVNMFALVLAVALGGHVGPGKPPEGAVCNPAEVAAAMKQLAQHPDDLTVRRRLLTYYLHRHQDPALRKARIEQIAWMVEHHPAVKLFDQRAWIVDTRDREGFAGCGRCGCGRCGGFPTIRKCWRTPGWC